MPLPVTYATVEDVYRNQPALSSISAITSQVLAFFLGKADALIDGKIVKTYSLPLSSVPPLLTAISADIATYYVVAQRLFVEKKLAESEWPKTFKAALDTLNEIADGAIPLTASGGAIIAARTDTAEVWSNTMDYVPTFSELPDWDNRLDDDKVDDIESDKGLA